MLPNSTSRTVNHAARFPVAALALFLTLASVPAAAGAAQEATLRAEDLSGLQLRTIGPAAMSGRIVDIAVVESDPYTFYAASATGGLWKTTNNGVTFEPVFENEATHSIGAIAVNQDHPEILWVGTGERANRQSSSWGDGVYKSTDAGETWTNVGLRDSHHIGRIVLQPGNANVAYVAAMGHLWGANEERGLYRTSDGGETWERLLNIDPDTGVVDVAMDPEDSSILYAATYQRRRTAFGFHGGGPGSGLFKSTDGGETWTELTAAAIDPDGDNPKHPGGTLTNGLPGGDLGRIGISIYRSDPRIVYATIEQGLRYTASTSYEERAAGIYRSEDRGETWEHMSDWNPRPMYASQIAVDPSDDQRIYQMNSYSYSDDGGRTFTSPRQSIHGDDRYIWIDPEDSRHVMKASDGALGISYDRGITWLFVSHLPVSQYYRVEVDMRDPYWVYGGLQDNGSWMGPNETYHSEGILNEDWVRIGGGDGFVNIVDPSDPSVAYVESQYLGLTRMNLSTLERQSIRPGNPEGNMSGRRNWDYWGSGEEGSPLEQMMEPANWDGPVILSPHDPQRIYAGTENLYVSDNRGGTWRDLGRMSDVWERAEVPIMGQMPTASTVSLDDGVPFFATATAIAESPLVEGLLYVGTDDGNVQVSHDAGETWINVADRFPGLPARTWVADVEASPHEADTVFAAFDGHREDDFTNYLYRSDDRGESWTSIAGDMPADRVMHALRQDAVNPDLLYAATEIGFFVSIDAGAHWVELRGGMPTLPFNDFVVHPRDNDLVLGSHGRGIWILDSVQALRGLNAEVIASAGHVFEIDDARMMRRAAVKPPTGDMTFRGANPPNGAIIDYWLREDHGSEEDEDSGESGDQSAATDGAAADRERAAPDSTDPPPVTLTVHDSGGREIRRLEPTLHRGVNRVVWDLRMESLPPPARMPRESGSGGGGFGGGFGGGGGRGAAGPLVVPGRYTVRLVVDGQPYERAVEVEDDPRVRIRPEARRAWTRLQLQLGEMYVSANELVAEIIEHERGLMPEAAGDAGEADEAAAMTAEGEAVAMTAQDEARLAPVRELRELCEELRGRLLRLRSSIAAWTGPETEDQRTQMDYLGATTAELRARWQELAGVAE